MAEWGWYYLWLGIDDYRGGDYRSALANLNRLGGPFFFIQPALVAMCQAELGAAKEARQALERAMAVDPTFAKDPRGREYLWIGGALQPHDAIAGSDTEAYEQGVASVTPLLLDLTCSSDAPLVESLVSQFAPR